MAQTSPSPHPAPVQPPFEGLDVELEEQLPVFETFFKTCGFKRIHGRVWGLLILAGQALSMREIADSLSLSQASASTCLNELQEWDAVHSRFDPARRCHLHEPNGNTLSIVATVFRRREQVAFARFKHSARQALGFVQERYGERDARAISLRSIITSCELAEAVMQLVLTSVERALGDPTSLLAKAVSTALKVGMAIPTPRLGFRRARAMDEVHDATESVTLDALRSVEDQIDPGQGDAKGELA